VPGLVKSDRICAGNRHPAPADRPVLADQTGKVERLHKTMRAEFFTPKDRMYATVEELQAAP
jgi:hypothetical protein